MKPKSTHKQAATHNRDTKQTTEHKKERPKTQPPRSFPSLQNIPLYFEATGTRGASLVCRSVTARLPVSRMWSRFAHCGHLFGRATTMSPKNPISVGGSRWTSKREIRLGSDIRSGRIGVDVVETMTKRVKMVEKTVRRTSVSSGTTSEKPIYIPR
jgi:hypothetical protein